MDRLIVSDFHVNNYPIVATKLNAFDLLMVIYERTQSIVVTRK